MDFEKNNHVIDLNGYLAASKNLETAPLGTNVWKWRLCYSENNASHVITPISLKAVNLKISMFLYIMETDTYMKIKFVFFG